MNYEYSIFRYDTAIEDVKESAKWPIGLFGVVLTITVVLGAVQLIALALSDLSSVRPHVWFALAVTLVAIGVSLFLAVEERVTSAHSG